VSDAHFETQHLHAVLDRWRAGDRDAANDLCLGVGRRLELLGRKMLGGFPNVRSLADTDDVVQNSLVRLLTTLKGLRPGSTRDFFNLAAVHLRRELLDLSRRVAARPDFRRPVASPGGTQADPLAGVAEDDVHTRDDDLDLWCRFHEAVDHLPATEREVVGLSFYHGWTQAQIAELFQVDERTVRRWWRSACARLSEALRGQLPRLTESV
jgi:RNA polymerase sigma-70 factor (ECF subfamily)